MEQSVSSVMLVEETCPHHVLTGGVLGSRQDSRLLHTPAAICYGVMIHDGVMYAHYLTVGYTRRCVVVCNCNDPRGGGGKNEQQVLMQSEEMVSNSYIFYCYKNIGVQVKTLL